MEFRFLGVNECTKLGAVTAESRVLPKYEKCEKFNPKIVLVEYN